MVNKVCLDCTFAMIHQSSKFHKCCICQNEERHRSAGSRVIGKKLKDCQHKKVKV